MYSMKAAKRKKKVANVMLVVFLAVCIDWMKGNWVSVTEHLSTRI